METSTATPPSTAQRFVFKSVVQKSVSSPPNATTMAKTARRGTLRCIMVGVTSETASGMAEYNTAVMEEVTCCSPQKSNPYGSAMIVRLNTKIEFHCCAPAGQRLFCTNAIPSSIAPATKKRRAAARNGGTSLTTNRIASHVLPQIRHKEI